jgi:hypothetical protein
MSVFTPANLPSGIGSLEELVAWGVSALAQVNNGVLIQTSAGQTEPVAQAQTYRFPYLTTAPERLICVAYLPLTENWRSAGKLWDKGIGEISSIALPPEYTTN